MNIKTKFVNSLKELSATKSIALAGMLLAIVVILNYYSNFSLVFFQLVKMNLGFLPQTISSTLLGPVVGGIIYGLGDLLSFMLNPQGGAYFFGWTFNAALSGMIFGLFLYKSNFCLKNLIFAKLISLACVEITLGTVWLYLQFGFPFWPTMLTRLIAESIISPIEIIITFIVFKFLNKSILKLAKN